MANNSHKLRHKLRVASCTHCRTSSFLRTGDVSTLSGRSDMMRCNTSAHCASPSVQLPTVLNLVPATWRQNATITTKLRVACATSAKRASPPAWLSLLCSVLVFPHPVMHGDSGACQMRDAARQDLPDTRCCERGLVYHIPGPETGTKAAGARPARAQVRALWKCWPEPAQRHVRRSGLCRWRATTTRNRVRLARATDENGASHGHPTASRERSGVYWKESMGAAAGRADPRPPTASKACHESEFGAAGGCTRGPGRLVCLCVPVCLCVFPVCPHTSPCVHVYVDALSPFFPCFLSLPPSQKKPSLSLSRTHTRTHRRQ